MEDKNIAIGIYTIAEFHLNKDQDSQNKVISRSLGKFGLIDNSYEGEYPKQEEFWLVKIKNNIRPELAQGCFILDPILKVDFTTEVGKLVSGMYKTEEFGPALVIITPNEEYKGKFWQIPLEERKKFKNKAVVVKQFYEESNEK